MNFQVTNKADTRGPSGPTNTIDKKGKWLEGKSNFMVIRNEFVINIVSTLLGDIGDNDTNEEDNRVQPVITEDEGNDEEGHTKEHGHACNQDGDRICYHRIGFLELLTLRQICDI